MVALMSGCEVPGVQSGRREVCVLGMLGGAEGSLEQVKLALIQVGNVWNDKEWSRRVSLSLSLSPGPDRYNTIDIDDVHSGGSSQSTVCQICQNTAEVIQICALSLSHTSLQTLLIAQAARLSACPLGSRLIF